MFHQRPSALLGLVSTGVPDHDAQRAFFLDRAVFLFGSALEEALEVAGEKSKTKKGREAKVAMELSKWLAEPGETRGRFRDPAARG